MFIAKVDYSNPVAFKVALKGFFLIKIFHLFTCVSCYVPALFKLIMSCVL